MGRHNVSYWGLALPVIAINVAVLVVFVILTVLQFDQVRSSLESERLQVVADRASGPLATAAAIGLDLTTVRSLDVILETARQADDAIIALHVLDPSGAIVASTAADPRTAVGPKTMQSLRQNAASAGFKENGDFRYLITFNKGTGEIAGALLIEYSSAAARTSVWAMTGRLATMALVFSLVSSVFSVWVIKMALKREARIDHEIAAEDIASLRQLWRGSGESPDGAVGDGIAGAIREAEIKYRAAREAKT